MKNNYFYEKLVLEAVGSIDEAINQMDKTVVRKGVGTFLQKDSSSKQIEQMLMLMERKFRLQELKKKVNKVLSRMSDEELQLFSYKYFEKTKFISLDCKSRTYFRKQNKALKHFGELLNYIGLSKQRFKAEYFDIPYISALSATYTNQSLNDECAYVREILS